MQILLRADSTTNGSGSIKTRITMLEHQATRARTSRGIIHALYAYNSYIRALTYRKRRRQLHSIYTAREYCALEEIARIFPLPGSRNSAQSSLPGRVLTDERSSWHFASRYCTLINFHIESTRQIDVGL